MYKKIYIEITNICNLKCAFCPHNKRTNKNMTMNEFKIILEKIKNHTKYIYLHVLGEPLMHPEFNEFVDLASKQFNVNITTNGFLINRIKTTNIRQINISLQSFDKSISLDEYMNNLFSAIERLKNNTFISLRLWVKNKYTCEIINYIERYYNKKIELCNNYKNITLEKNVFLSFNEEFIWPNINSTSLNESGTCYALKDHIGILVDGQVIPCCLDSEGIINLGNIYNQSLESIIEGKRYQNMLNGFKNNKKCEKLCQTCSFIK